MAFSDKTKEYLDSLSDDELLIELNIRFGESIPVWEECSKEEYEENYGKDDYNTISLKGLLKWINSPNTYKREPHWNNAQSGILWQIQHAYDKPDYYTYHKLVEWKHVLMIGNNIMEYLYDRKPYWLKDMTL